MSQIVLAIDIGTTAIKFDLYEAQYNHRMFQVVEKVETIFTDHGEVYQEANKILDKVVQNMKKLHEVYAFQKVVFSTPMHTLVPIKNHTYNHMTIWSDRQANEIARHLKKTNLGKKAYFRTGTPLHPMNPFCRLAFYKEKQADYFSGVSHWADLKSLLISYFCEEWVTDYASASASGLFNSEEMCWDKKLLCYLGLNVDQFPKVVPPSTVFDCSERTVSYFNGGEFKIVIGASDGCLASYASHEQGQVNTTLTVGTSGAIRMMVADRQVDTYGRYFCYCLDENHWVVGGPTNNGGKVLTWLSQLLYQSETEIFEYIEEAISNTSMNVSGLQVYPYVFGERAPLWDGSATARFEGLTTQHTKEDMIRSTVEGIIFNLVYIARSMGIKDEPLAVSGGFFTIPGILQIVADIFQQSLLMDATNDPSYGAFLLTRYEEDEEGQKRNEKRQIDSFIFPNVELAHSYEKKYQRFAKGISEMLAQA